jgi:hypothetical protein
MNKEIKIIKPIRRKKEESRIEILYEDEEVFYCKSKEDELTLYKNKMRELFPNMEPYFIFLDSISEKNLKKLSKLVNTEKKELLSKIIFDDLNRRKENVIANLFPEIIDEELLLKNVS